MKRGYWALFCILTVFSCTNRDRVPSGIIEPDSMRVIMHDMIIADQFVTQYVIKDSLTRDVKKESQDWYEKLFSVHHTTREIFRKSLSYYSSRPDLEKVMFDSLGDAVSRERTAMYKEKYGVRDSLAKLRADSIAKVRAGPPPLNPDSLKRTILLAHPGLPMPVLLDSVHQRLKIRAAEDSVRNATRIRDSIQKHVADSVRLRKVSDSIRKARPAPKGPPPGQHKPFQREPPGSARRLISK